MEDQLFEMLRGLGVAAPIVAVLAWLLRSEMMLLLLPLAGLAGLWVWSEERPVLTKRNGIAYLGLFGLILAGMLAGGAVDRLACGSAGPPVTASPDVS